MLSHFCVNSVQQLSHICVILSKSCHVPCLCHSVQQLFYAEFSCIFFFNSCVFYNIVFSGRSWLIYLASCCSTTLPLKMAVYVEVCQAISSCCIRKSSMYTSGNLVTFEWRPNESLGALSLRNNAIEAHFQVDCRVVLLPKADECKAQTYFFKWSPLQCDVNRN